jgi:hypothetical protein
LVKNYNNPLLTQRLRLVTSVVAAAILFGGFVITPSYGQATPTTLTETIPFEPVTV